MPSTAQRPGTNRFARRIEDGDMPSPVSDRERRAPACLANPGRKRPNAGAPHVPDAMPAALQAGSPSRSRRHCDLAREIASAVLDVPVDEIARPSRSIAETCQARHVAMYLAHVVFQVPLGRIAVSFGRDRTSVAHAVRRIEDERDDERFDRLLARLERLASACRLVEADGEGTL